jgi:hypothetical protein
MCEALGSIPALKKKEENRKEKRRESLIIKGTVGSKL